MSGADLHHQVVGAPMLLSAHSAAIEFGEQRVSEILRSDLAVKCALVDGEAYLMWIVPSIRPGHCPDFAHSIVTMSRPKEEHNE